MAESNQSSINVCQPGKKRGRTEDGRSIGKSKKHLQLGEILAVKIEVTDARSSSNESCQRGSSQRLQHSRLLKDSTTSEADIDKEQENLRSSGLNPERPGKIQLQ
ncbi:MAG: hypothetical protein EZS28_029047 [Streblomastix strix]|uniref:Uncharacterized protein n=1 Tax=Streblomastix strix TaxID=222440 RepID=A0A5J4V067_9EUKA|nr:MAG: hypothetical protein EZS28_029047 [Streblomastix strix]